MDPLVPLLAEIRACTVCTAQLPLGPRPVLQAHPSARLLIAAQAPGRAVHLSGIPFDDASGDRLRRWLGVPRETFHDARRIAIVPMAFCYPGPAASGDRPPRPECAPRWRAAVLAHLRAIELTLVIGRHAMAWHLPGHAGGLAQAVRRSFDDPDADVLVLPHPSPRNNVWLAQHRWFEAQLVPQLQARVTQLLGATPAMDKPQPRAASSAAPPDDPR